MKKDIPIQPTQCPKCHYKIDTTTGAFGDHTPKSGDYSLCLCCGHVSVFNADRSLREPTDDERKQIRSHNQLIKAQLVRHLVVGDKIKERMKNEKTNTN